MNDLEQLPLVEKVAVSQNPIPMYHLGHVCRVFKKTQDLPVTARVIEARITLVLMHSDSNGAEAIMKALITTDPIFPIETPIPIL